MSHTTDIDLETGDILELGSLDAIVSFFSKLGYDTGERAPLTPEAIGLAGDSAKALKKVELISEDSEQFMRVVFAQSKSLTAKVRNDLARVLGKSTTDHVVVLTADFTTLEFVFLDKRRKQSKGPAGIQRVQVVPKTISVNRRTPTRLDLRILRRFTWTCQDALDQFDKLRSVFDAAAYTGRYFQNRGLFSDYFLRERLREDDNWRENPSDMFSHVRDFMQDAPKRWSEKEKNVARKELYEPIFKRLGFKPRVNRPSKTDQTQPDYLLKDDDDNVLSAAFVYQWDRWLDGPDLNDPDTPDENPGACVVSALDEGIADWIIVTNGRHWRLYGKQAHARSTNFYEVDLIEALLATGDTDPNEAFRYWWLFFRPEAYRRMGFQPVQSDAVESDGLKTRPTGDCWLDAVLRGSREYAKRLGNRLKDRVFLTIFPHLARGFLEDRKKRLEIKSRPTEEELDDIFEATLTFLYRLLFLLYSESRNLVPINEAPYQAASLKRIKEEVAEKAGVAESEVADLVKKAYSASDTTIYDRLCELFHAMDEGDTVLNVPTYNGGLFNTVPNVGQVSNLSGTGDRQVANLSYENRNQHISQFLLDHKIPDRQLALAIDRLSRDQDERTLALAFIDYKSLEVRHLGSIYEGLLEFKLKIAAEDLTTKKEKGTEKYIPLSSTKSKKKPEIEVAKGSVYLSNDNAERKASGSYYTPDPIVEYIVANTVGPVLDEKLEALRADFRKVRKTFDNEIKKAKVAPIPQPLQKGEMDERQWANLKTYQAHKDLVDRLFDLHVCDPAMGSGHFLVEVVDFVTDRLLKFLNQFPINPVNYALERTRASILESLGEQGVTVDPANLTDINLLKRHVLKRCIYGVDLNPMAVELAKVSLWLDCFTLGAPLNFLDHHLRCGNSLIGATFDDLEKATTGRLFTINYEPLLRAINHVLQVSKLADATAAEVATSVTQYDTARQELTGYQVILDLLVAKHFGFPNAPGIVEQGQNIDLATKDKFLESLEDDDERQLVMDVENLARQRDQRFFHWEIEFPEIFFGFMDEDQRQLRHKDQIESGTAGFDCICGNPPYDVLAERELGFDLSKFKAFIHNQSVFGPACRGKQNLYKLFVCRGVSLIRTLGRLGNIVPMALLGDDQAAGVRKMLLKDARVCAIEAFPQKDDPRNRVFEDAKLSTCVFIVSKGHGNEHFRSRVHSGNVIERDSPSLTVRQSEVDLYDPDNQPIVACSQDDWNLVTRIKSSGRIRRLGEFCEAFQGEVNETTDGRKGNVSYDEKDGPSILRGSNVCLYVLRPASQGEPMFLHKDKYLNGKRPDSKGLHYQHRRVGLQESCPQNNFRRIIAALIPQGEFCNHKINYFPEHKSEIQLEALLALLNSKLCDWYFRLGSTNAAVSHYQLHNLPAPAIAAASQNDRIADSIEQALSERDLGKVQRILEPELRDPPFSRSVLTVLTWLTQEVIRIETERGNITRAERSALSKAAQAYQELIDRILYRIAGLTDSEAMQLESRLKEML